MKKIPKVVLDEAAYDIKNCGGSVKYVRTDEVGQEIYVFVPLNDLEEGFPIVYVRSPESPEEVLRLHSMLSLNFL